VSLTRNSATTGRAVESQTIAPVQTAANSCRVVGSIEIFLHVVVEVTVSISVGSAYQSGSSGGGVAGFIAFSNSIAETDT